MPKPKLTPEERKLIKQEKKAEKKRLAALKKRQQKFDYLEREVKYSDLTVRKHEKNWRRMLIKISVPRMREDLEFAWHNFERVIDSKDFTISLLMDELKDAEEQYMFNLRSHVENIDRLIQMLRDRLEELKENNKLELEELEASAEKEAEDIRLTAADGENYLKTMLYTLELARKKQEKRVRGELLSRIDEEDTKYADIINRLRGGLEVGLGRMWNNIQAFIQEYNTRTARRKNDYLLLKEQDDSVQNVLQERLRKIRNLHQLIKKLKDTYCKMLKERNITISDLVDEKQFFSNAFSVFKKRLEANNATDKQKIILLTTKSKETAAVLNELRKKGEWILTLAAVCRKMETEKEKIMSFPVPQTAKQTAGKSVTDLRSLDNVTEDLNLFWFKVAQADALRYSINEERVFLQQQNKILKAKIHRYCQCLDCPVYPPVVQKKNINVVDANHFMQKYTKY